MEIVELTPAIRERIERIPNALPVHHPVWIDVLSTMGDDVHGIAALDSGEVRGWLMYAVTKAHGVTVVNSLPFIAYGGPHGFEAKVDLEEGVRRRRSSTDRSDTIAGHASRSGDRHPRSHPSRRLVPDRLSIHG